MTNTTKRVIPIFFATALWLPPAAMGQEPAKPPMTSDRAMAEMMSGMSSKHQEMAELLAKALEDVKALQSEKEAEERKGPRE